MVYERFLGPKEEEWFWTLKQEEVVKLDNYLINYFQLINVGDIVT